jgi:hypothetical protein
MLLEQFNDEFDDAIEVEIAAELSEQSTKEKRERCKPFDLILFFFLMITTHKNVPLYQTRGYLNLLIIEKL